MKDENPLKPMSLSRQHKLDAWRYRELRLAIILLLKIFLIALPFSMFMMGCSHSGPTLNPVPQMLVKIYSLEPSRGGIVRRGAVTSFVELEGKHFVVIAPEDFGELLNRCPIK